MESAHQHGVDGAGRQAGLGEIAEPEVRLAAEPAGLCPGLAERYFGEVHADQPGVRAGRDLQAVAAAPATEVKQYLTGPQPQLLHHLGDALNGDHPR